MLPDGTINAEATSIVNYVNRSKPEILGIESVLGDGLISPSPTGLSTDISGLVSTGDWQQGNGHDGTTGDDINSLLSRIVLRSVRGPRSTHRARYEQVVAQTRYGTIAPLGPLHVLSRAGGRYAPLELEVDLEGLATSGRWYRTRQDGFTDDLDTVFDANAKFIGIGSGSSPQSAFILEQLGSSFFNKASKVVATTDTDIPAGSAPSSIGVETMDEPLLKAGDVLVILRPNLNPEQVRLTADQVAGATSLGIEDLAGGSHTFNEEVPAGSAIYLAEEELLTLARLGAEGFAVTVLGEGLGKVNGDQAGSLTSVAVKDWRATVAAGSLVWFGDTQVDVYGDAGLTEDVKAGATIVYLGDPTTLALNNGDSIKPEGSVSRGEFKVTANAISAYIGAPGNVIATVSAAATFDGTNTSIPVGTSLTNALVALDTVLIYKASGSVIKVTVKSSVSAGSSPIILSDGDGDQSGNISVGDKIVAGSVTGLRIDMNGIEVTASSLASSNYVAGSAGWSIFSNGSAEFNDVSIRGSITLTGTSTGLSNFDDAGALAFGDDLDDVNEGLNFRRWPVTGKPPTNTGAVGSGLYVGLDNLGYWDSTASGGAGAFTTYMDNAGNFYLTGSPGYLSWTAATSTLTIKGTLDGADGTFSGSLSAATGTFSGDLSAAGGTFAGSLSAATGTFSGNLSAAGGTFGGSLSAATGTFSGDISGASGTFTGGVSGAGYTLDGTALTMTQGSISIGTKFSVSSSGILSATDGSFTGSVAATSGSLSSLDVTGVLTIQSGGAIVSSSGANSIYLSWSGGLDITTGSVSANLSAGLLTVSNTTSGSTSVSVSASLSGASIVVNGGGNGSILVDSNAVWHAGNDGPSSGLDADLLDAQQGSYYLALANATGTLALANGGTGAATASGARTNLGLGSLAVLSSLALGDLSNVEGVGSPNNGDVLTWNSTAGAWVAQAP